VSSCRPGPERGRCPCLLVSIGAVFLIIVLVRAASAAPAIDLKPIATGLAMPTTIVHAGDGSGRLFITLQAGQIMIHDGTGLLPTPFLDISTIISCCGERGLLGLAFHPDYTMNGLFYVHYTNSDGDVVIARYAVSGDPNRAQPSGTVLLTIPHRDGSNHNGGQLAFGPDGYLYIAVGDGGGAGDTANNAQNLGSLLGKILRIDVDGPPPYAIPPTNPFRGTSGARAEIWAYGLRNSWRFSFDRLTGDLFIGDVGQNAWEEINFQPASSPGGQNYGWRRMEGTHCFNPDDPNKHPETCDKSGLTMPIAEYGNLNVVKDGKGISVTAGYVYRGKAMPPLQGAYVFGDWSRQFLQPEGLLLVAWPPKEKGAMWTIEDVEVVNMKFHSYVLAFAQDEDNELYVLVSDNTAPTRGIDKIYKIMPAD